MARSDGLIDKAKKKAKKAAASYMNKAKTQSLAGRVTNTDTRMARLGDLGAKKKGGK